MNQVSVGKGDRTNEAEIAFVADTSKTMRELSLAEINEVSGAGFIKWFQELAGYAWQVQQRIIQNGTYPRGSYQ